MITNAIKYSPAGGKVEVTLIGANISAVDRKNVTAQLYNVPATCMK